MEPIKFSAKTLDDAITRACVELGVTSEMIHYDIVDSGSAGIFGIGARPCVIEVALKEEKAEEKPRKKASVRENDKEPVNFEKTVPEQKKTADASKDVKKEASEEQKPHRDGQKPHREGAAVKKAPEGSRRENAETFLKNLFEAMKMDVDIVIDQENEEEISITLSGKDMGVLIGKRGQTLDALQYLTGQVINKHYNDYVRVKIDTENYRERRKDTLETLAVNIAGKVRRTRKPVALEPMNPYERRLIHSILQNEKDIFTRSEGEEPYRHVVIYCTRKKK